MTDHTYKQYDAELESVRSLVLQMGGLVEQQIIKAFEGLESGDMKAIQEVIERDAEINRCEMELDEACSYILARRQPAAGDLRMLFTVIKMITDLERAGDEAVKVARMSLSIHQAGKQFMPFVELAHMSNGVTSMLRGALDAFARLDAQAAAQVVRQDDAIDHEWSAVMRQLITFMMEDARTISRSIELLFIAKALERIGDHAKNMCEYIVYMVKGRDVRHIGIDDLEREVMSNN